MKKNRLGIGIIAFVVVGISVVTGLLISPGPRFPVAVMRVVDEAGKPVAGAVIQPEGMRTKQGPYVSGWYGWRTDNNSPTNAPVTTDKNGYASVPYPKYVFERIETGTLCLAVNHPEFVPDRPERMVASALPAGAPWRDRVDDFWQRIQHKVPIITHADPIVLKKGATLILSVRPGSGPQDGTPLFAQVSTDRDSGTNFWTRPEAGVLVTRRLAPGSPTVRAIRFDSKGLAWFSDVFTVNAVARQTNEMVVDLKPGVTVRGQLDATALRPIKNGRVIVHVWPQGQAPSSSPPQWHSWTTVREDGSFEITSLPAGDLEIIALCDGYVSTTGSTKPGFRYPQKYLLGTEDMAVTIAMEPTVRLEVLVTDDKGMPLKGAAVLTWPNARYGDWAAVILGSDRYNTSDALLAKTGDHTTRRYNPIHDFNGTSDSNGVAILPNLPADVTQFTVEHPHFALPATKGVFGEKRRQAAVKLQAGTTNHAAVQLEPRDQSPIAHY